MAISNNNTGIRTGVCTSTTRPTAPYEGQHIYETDTDIEYVWNGSAWVVNYVSAASPAFTGTPSAPTATAGTNTTQLATTAFANTAGGLVYITGGALSGTATNFAGCFTSTYRNYRIEVTDLTQLVGWCAFRFLQGGTAIGANYYYSLSGRTSSNAIVGDSGAGVTFIGAGYVYQSTATGSMSCSYDIFSPQQAKVTFTTGGYSTMNSGTSYNFYTGGAAYDGSAVFDGIQVLTTGAGSMDGNVRIYGYRD